MNDTISIAVLVVAGLVWAGVLVIVAGHVDAANERRRLDAEHEALYLAGLEPLDEVDAA